MRKAALAAAAAALLVPHLAQGQSVGGVVSGVTGTVGGAVSGAGGTVSGVGGAVGSVGGAVGGPVGGAIGGVGGAVGSVGGAVGGVGGAIGGIGGGVGGGVGGGGIGGASGAGSFGGGGLGGAGSGFGVASTGPATTGSIGAGTGLGAGPGSAVGSLASIALPAALAPCDDGPRRRGTARISLCGPRYAAYFPEIGQVRGTREDLESFRTPLRPRPGTPQDVVQNCRTAIVAAALPYGVVRVDAASAGPMRSARGGFAAPVEFRIVYNRQGGLETRQATINCRLNTAGRVIAAA
jgi:hypothetical protein